MKARDKVQRRTSILDIDRFRLDEEWVEQPRLYSKYAKMLAEKKLELDTAKAKLDVVFAECYRDIAENPVKYKAKKTEPGIKTAVLLQVAHQKALRRVNRLKYEVAMTQAMVSALDHRKKALEDLVSLWGMDYFSELRAKGNRKGRNMTQEAEKRRVRTSGDDE